MQRKSGLGRVNLPADRVRHKPWATAAATGGHRDVLFTVNAVRHREALNGCREFCFPEELARFDIKGLEHLSSVSDENNSTGCRKDRSQECRALLMRPHFLQGLHIIGREFSDIAVAARHFIKGPTCSSSGI